MNWKLLAILLIILQVIEILFVGTIQYIVSKEEDNTRYCYYDICEGYPEAAYANKVCYCYDLDITGSEYIVKKTEILK